MKFVKMFLALVGLAVLFVFVRDNTGKIVVKFWEYATPEIEIFLVLIITFVLGMIVASFGSTLKILQLKRQLKNAGANKAEQVKENKKEKKSKHKKNDKDKVEPDTATGSSGSYASTGATAATAAGSAYTSDSDVSSTPEADAPETGSSAAEPVKEHNDEPRTDEVKDAEEESASEDSKADEVIALPADEDETRQEGRN